MQNSELFEKLYRKIHHVVGMLLFAMIQFSKRSETESKYVRNRLVHCSRHGIVENKSRSQTARRNDDIVSFGIFFESSYRRKSTRKYVRSSRRNTLYSLLSVDIESS